MADDRHRHPVHLILQDEVHGVAVQLRVTGQKDPILGSQRAAGAQNLVLFHRQLCQFGRMGGDGLHVTAAALQRGDLCVQRGQLLQNIFYHSCFPPA